MSTFGTFLDLGILWFLITLFTGSIDSERSFREAWIVAFGVKIIGFVCHAILDKAWAPLSVVVELGVLYFLVERVCETERRATLKICGWYLAICLALGIAFQMLQSMRVG